MVRIWIIVHAAQILKIKFLERQIALVQQVNFIVRDKADEKIVMQNVWHDMNTVLLFLVVTFMDGVELPVSLVSFLTTPKSQRAAIVINQMAGLMTNVLDVTVLEKNEQIIATQIPLLSEMDAMIMQL